MRNTREGYEPENATTIPDGVDHGHGFAAGQRVVVIDDHDVYGGEEGEVWAVAYGKGWYGGRLVLDVLIDGTSEPERFTIDEVEGA